MSTLTADEKAIYFRTKAIVKAALDSIVEKWYVVGENLKEIKHRELYLAEFTSWEEFCSKCCEFSRRRADQIIQDVETRQILAEVHGLGTIIQQLPQAAVSALADVPASQVEKTIAAASQEHGRPTAKAIKRVRARIIDAETGEPDPLPEPPAAESPASNLAPEPKLCPTCGQLLR